MMFIVYAYSSCIADLGWQYYVNEGNTKIRPVSAVDVAEALQVMLTADSTTGKTYELYGPKEYTIKEIFDIAREITMKPLPIRAVPNKILE